MKSWKFFFRTALVFIFFFAVVSISINILLGISKSKIVAAAQPYISDRFDIGNAVYLFPNIVVLKDVVLTPQDCSNCPRIIKLPTVTLEFSLLEFLRHRNVAVQKLKIYSPYIHHGYFSELLKKDGRRLMEFVLQLPRMDFRFSMKEALWDFTANPSGTPDYLQLNFVFLVKKDTVSLQGTARKDQYSFSPKTKMWQRQAKGFPLEFGFKGFLEREGLFIDHLSFTRKNIHLKLWGSLLNDKLQLNGFSFLNTYPHEGYQPLKSVKQWSWVRQYLRKVQKQKKPAAVSLEDKDLYITDINCLAKIMLPRIDLERFDFYLNDVPVSVKGQLSFDDLFSTDLEIGLDPAKSKNFPMKNLSRIQWHLTGASDGKVFTSDSDIHVSFDKAKNANFPVEKIDSDLKGLRFLLDHSRPSVYLQQADTRIIINKKVHKLFLQGATISLNPLKKTLRLVELKSPFYSGLLLGRFWVTTGAGNPKIDGALALTDVDVHQLGELFPDLAKAEGKLFGRVHLTTVPRLNIDGQFDMYNGRLKNYAFFQWLADTFNLPSLQQVDFKQVSSGFTADMEAFKFNGILLNSEKVNIQGDFSIDKNSLVTSYLSLAFSKDLLHESAKFRPIIKIFDETIPMVIFDFQLSGRQDALSFQWLPSDHKEMIQRRIPNFIERIIERNIDEMMVPAEEAAPPQPDGEEASPQE